ncbi:hypothetical protein ACVWYH_000931 [Bradyrhizobium sp. GM24.11]
MQRFSRKKEAIMSGIDRHIVETPTGARQAKPSLAVLPFGEGQRSPGRSGKRDPRLDRNAALRVLCFSRPGLRPA